MSSKNSRLNWVEEYVRGNASPETMMLLESELKTDASFREDFIEYLNIDLALSLDAAFLLEEDSNVVKIRKPKVRYFLAAAVAIFLAGVWWFQSESPVARVTSHIGVPGLNSGSKIYNNRIVLDQGILALKTTLGAEIVIEAPAEFQFESTQKLRLFYGRLAAEVPDEAHGFSVLTPTGTAIDLGTEFGVDVPKLGEPEIHVFKGEVIAQTENGVRKNLYGGDAFSLNSDAGLSRELRSAAFVRADEMALLHGDETESLLLRSDELLSKLRTDPALIALLDFESDANLPQGHYRMVQGRWPGSHAPEFVESVDHIKLDVGGDHEWPQFTLAAWVRLDRLGAPYQSLLHTDGWDKNRLGQVHWMVTRHTTMRLALFGNTLVPSSPETEVYPDSHTSVLPAQGRWVHLATTYNSVDGAVRFYLNGQFDSESRQEVAHPAVFGPAQIGNWDQHDRKLSGRIDELILLGRIMSDSEIGELFEVGNPYRN